MMPVIIIAQSIVIIGLLVLLGMTTGGLKKQIDRASRHLEATPKLKDPEPICGCQHHQCFHDDTGCKSSSSAYRGDHWGAIECGCLRYVGPEALPMVLP